MENVLEMIEKYKLIKKGEVIGVGVSGGSDSMALIHFLKSKEEDLDFEVVAITIDHSIREDAANDVRFVMEYCRENRIRAYKFKVDAPKLAREKGISIESAARRARFGVFDALVKKGVVDKIALAHHMSDQAETILLHILRGAGANGVRGMEPIRDDVYIRPMLGTEKRAVMSYCLMNRIDYVVDKTNEDDAFSRNFIRNRILSQITKKWPGAIPSLINFSRSISEDNDYISSQIFEDALIYDYKDVKIPLSYFLYHNAIVSRLIFTALKKIGVEEDIERKHIELIIELARAGGNGKKLHLPKDLSVHREYEYITISNRFKEKRTLDLPFKCGTFVVPEFGTLVIKRAQGTRISTSDLTLDLNKVPKGVRWRFRQDGDVFTKFASGEKKLKSFFVNKKIPQRQRDGIPILALDNEVFAVAGYEISDKVKVDGKTKSAYIISVKP